MENDPPSPEEGGGVFFNAVCNTLITCMLYLLL